MIQAILPFITAIVLSGIAAFYSVIGLAQIFPGSFWPIIIMGSSLELAKLVTVSWLYNNWKETVNVMRYYFIVAILLLMLITSMGIFGFLSKAHLESNVSLGANNVQLQILNTQEKNAKDKLTYLLKQSEDPTKNSTRLDRDIRIVQGELAKITQEKLPLMTEENKLAAEIGPIKYVAELFYNTSDGDFIDKAVRLVIMVIIFVFDPLAVLLLIAANQTWRNRKESLDKQASNSVELIPKEQIVYINWRSE